MALKDEIRSRRVAAGMAQTDLANALGLCTSTIYNWERGTSKPNLRKVHILAKALGVTEQDLLNPSKESEDSNNVL